MAQFNYLNEINSIITMDGEITRGPVPRWQKKLDMSSSLLNSSMNTSKAKLSVSYNNGYNNNNNANNAGNKTPNKGITSDGKKTPSGKSPGNCLNLIILFYNIINYIIVLQEEKRQQIM